MSHSLVAAQIRMLLDVHLFNNHVSVAVDAYDFCTAEHALGVLVLMAVNEESRLMVCDVC